MKNFLRHEAFRVYPVFFLLTLFVRAAFFFDYVINWDESTYILMGQGILDGILPYTSLWDMKPPLVFLVYALFIFFFGRHIESVRFGGALLVFAGACFLYHAVKRVYGKASGFWAAVLLIVYSATFAFGGAVMTEHLAILPLCALLFFVSARPMSSQSAFACGLSLGACVMIRTNLAYAGFLLLPLIFYEGFLADKRRGALLHSGSFLAGGLLLPLLTFMIYAFAGEIGPLIRSNWSVALDYARENPASLWERTGLVFFLLRHSLFSLNFFFWVAGLGGLWFIYGRSGRPSEECRFMGLTAAIFLLVTLSMIKTGRAYQHYLLQMIPLAAVPGGVFLSRIFGLRGQIRWLGLILLITATFGISLTPVVRHYYLIYHSVKHGSLHRHDPVYHVAQHLNRQGVRGQYVYFADAHIGYWLTGAKIPTRYVQPANIAIDYMVRGVDGPEATPVSELQKILAQKPVYIVTRKNLWYFQTDCPVCGVILNRALKEHYYLEAVFGHLLIYRRRRDLYDLPSMP